MIRLRPTYTGSYCFAFFFLLLPYLSYFSVFLKFLNRIEMSASNLGHPSVEEVPPHLGKKCKQPLVQPPPLPPKNYLLDVGLDWVLAWACRPWSKNWDNSELQDLQLGIASELF